MPMSRPPCGTRGGHPCEARAIGMTRDILLAVVLPWTFSVLLRQDAPGVCRHNAPAVRECHGSTLCMLSEAPTVVKAGRAGKPRPYTEGKADANCQTTRNVRVSGTGPADVCLVERVVSLPLQPAPCHESGHGLGPRLRR